MRNWDQEIGGGSLNGWTRYREVAPCHGSSGQSSPQTCWRTRKGRKLSMSKTVGLALDFFQIRDSHCPRSTGGGTESEGNLWVQIPFAEDWWSSVGEHRRETAWKDYEGNPSLKAAPFHPGYTASWGSCLVPLSSNKAKRGSEGQPTLGWLSCQQ